MKFCSSIHTLTVAAERIFLAKDIFIQNYFMKSKQNTVGFVIGR